MHDSDTCGSNGFARGLPASFYSQNPSFGPELLYSVNIDANGVGHYTQSNVCYQLVPPLNMKCSEIYNPQYIGVVGSDGVFAIDTVTAIRACTYAP